MNMHEEMIQLNSSHLHGQGRADIDVTKIGLVSSRGCFINIHEGTTQPN